MRIRKNAKLSSSWFSPHASAPETFQAHVCQLNQSPWDVMSFSPNSHQVEGDDSFTENASLLDSLGAVESVASPNGEDKVELGNYNRRKFDNNDHEKQKGEEFIVCNKTDGKGWKCRKPAREGHYLCEHHFNQVKSYSNNNSLHLSSIKKCEKSLNGVRRGRAKKKSSGPSSNPYEFYYYSGFGPKWGKKRGEKEKGAAEEEKEKNKSSQQAAATPSNSSQIDHTEEDLDYVDDDEDEEEEDDSGESKKKRIRRPVKERSLKSLM